MTGAGAGSGSGAGSCPGSGTGSRSGIGTGSGSGCPSGLLIKYSSTVWSRTGSGSTQTETSGAKNATWRSSSAADQMPQCSSVANPPSETRRYPALRVSFSEGFHAKALRALVANGDFRRLAAHIANVVCVFGPGGQFAGGLSSSCLLSNLIRRLTDSRFYRPAQPVCECKTPQTESVSSSRPIHFPASCGSSSNMHLPAEIPTLRPDASLDRTSRPSCKPAPSSPAQRRSDTFVRRSIGEMQRGLRPGSPDRR